MCSELFRIPVEWSGVPIFGFGALLALWLVAGGLWLVLSGRRTGWSADTMSYLPGLLIGAVAISLVPRVFPDGLPIRGYGVMVLTGALVAIGMAARRSRQIGLNPDVVYALAFWLCVCGVLGARLFYVIEYWETRFQFDSWSETLLAMVKFTEGGLVVYGSLIGGTIGFLWFVHRNRLPALAMADLVAPSLMVALAFGRIGCLLNGCCYGGETNRPWAITFPRASLTYMEQVSDGRMIGLRFAPTSAADPRPVVVSVDDNSPAAAAGLRPGAQIIDINGNPVNDLIRAQSALLVAFEKQLPVRVKTADGNLYEISSENAPGRSRSVHPTQIYSAINAGLLAWVLWSFYPLRRRDGEVLALMLSIYPISRFLLEIIRVDESPVFGTGLSISQNISVALLAVALLFWVTLLRRPPRCTTTGASAK